MSNIMFEKDLLYPTANVSEPGGIHVEIVNPNKKGRMPVIVESKTSHSPVEYINAIITIIQSDIFDRINVDVRKNVDLYIRLAEELKPKYGNKNYLLVVFNWEKIEYKGMDNIDN